MEKYRSLAFKNLCLAHKQFMFISCSKIFHFCISNVDIYILLHNLALYGDKTNAQLIDRVDSYIHTTLKPISVEIFTTCKQNKVDCIHSPPVSVQSLRQMRTSAARPIMEQRMLVSHRSCSRTTRINVGDGLHTYFNVDDSSQS